MTTEEMRDLRRLLAIMEDGETAKFLYCPEGADGFPLLYVDERLDPEKVMEIRRWSKQRIFVRGVLKRKGKGVIFRPARARNIELLQADLAGFFAAQIPPLRRSKVVVPKA